MGISAVGASENGIPIVGKGVSSTITGTSIPNTSTATATSLYQHSGRSIEEGGETYLNQQGLSKRNTVSFKI